MSIAGKRSTRGDNYETLIAIDWAMTVLSDPEYALAIAEIYVAYVSRVSPRFYDYEDRLVPNSSK